MSELHEAASMGDSDMIEELLNTGKYDVNLKDPEWNNRTPLHWATIKGHPESIRILIDKGAKAGSRTDTGWTAAHFAAETGRLGVLKTLSKLKAPMDKPDKYGDTPKRVAEIYGHQECVIFLEKEELRLLKARKLALARGKTLEEDLDDSDWERDDDWWLHDENSSLSTKDAS